ncbi:MAG TPA: TonB-dependent receptor [Opitutaceae bacterium]|nr:TonB-dependent receptor [Opitutaceae bacterium]
MSSFTLSRPAGWIFLASAALSTASAQTFLSSTSDDSETIPLDRIVISASRSPQDLQRTPSSVSLVSLSEIEREQIVDLRTALTQAPGIDVVNTGAVGGASAVFIRGASNHQTLFVVDGVRMNDRSDQYSPFLGSADLANIGRIEVLRGPQSTLFGSSAMGGVILIESQRGEGELRGSIDATAGSFQTLGVSAEASGSRNGLSYSAAVAHFETANDRAHNDLRQWTYATRLEYALNDRILFGTTFRAQNAEYEEAGSRVFPGVGDVDADNALFTVYSDVKIAPHLDSRLTFGLHRRTYRFADSFGLSHSSNTREIVDWQNTWSASPRLEVVAGTNFEWSKFAIETSNTRDQVAAGYVSATARPVKNVTLTVGGREDSFRSVGDAFTWRSGIAWQPRDGTNLHATYGTGFSAPGSDDRYGVPQYGQLPNPDLKPEKSRGWDVGIDQALWRDRLTLTATYFENRFRNLFEYEIVDFNTFAGRIVNRTRASSRGFEFGANLNITSRLHTRLAYTYVDARNDETGERLVRRPRHVADGEISYDVTGALVLGAGLHVAAGRTDSGVGAIEDYATARVFASYEAFKNLTLKVRVENALNEKYEDAYGYAALPFGAFGSVEWRF